MKQKKLLEKLMAFFDADAKSRKKQKSDIKIILKKLKKKERKLKEKLDSEKNVDMKKRLQQEIDIVYAQRKKGIKVIKDIL
jgi:predicted  nucleic acid-binding Zn-ribbon protein